MIPRTPRRSAPSRMRTSRLSPAPWMPRRCMSGSPTSTTRIFAGIYALDPAAVTQLLYHDPSNAPQIGTISDEDLETLARPLDAAALYVWEPYIHNPNLRRHLRARSCGGDATPVS